MKNMITMMIGIVIGAITILIILTVTGRMNYATELESQLPAVVCGSALCIVKYVKALLEKEEYGKIKRIFVIHSALIVFAVIIAAAYFLFK